LDTYNSSIPDPAWLALDGKQTVKASSPAPEKVAHKILIRRYPVQIILDSRME
jgi:hypothetical protein